MEAKEVAHRSGTLVEDPLVRMLGRAVPRLLMQYLFACVQFCADKMPKRVSMDGLRILAVLMVIVLPRTITYLLYPIFRLVFGNLYPAYASYKAVRTKNVKEYVSIRGREPAWILRDHWRRFSWLLPLEIIVPRELG